MARPAWRRLTLEVPAADAEQAGALLGDVSGAAVALEQREGSAQVAASVYICGNAKADNALARLRACVRSLWHEDVLRAAVVRQARVEERDWATAWKRHYRPLRLATGIYVVPTWNRDFRPPRGALALRLDPGMAFGTGRHATTKTAAALLLERVKPGAVVIDAGCGSGVLALAATLRGAKVYAFDEDPVAVRAARDNFTTNTRRPSGLVKADRMPRAFPKAALIVANITAEMLQRFARQFAARLQTGGVLISAGITARGRLATLAAFAYAGLDFVSERRNGPWFAYVHVKR